MNDNPVIDQGNNLPPGISSVEATSTGDNIYHLDPVEVTNEPESSSFWDYYLAGLGGAAAGGLSAGPLGFVLGGLGSLYSIYAQNRQREKEYERNKKDLLEAEQRANAEYDRRQKASQEYNDAWAKRLSAQGFNPLALLSKGSGATATNFSAPSTSPVPGAPRLSTPSMSTLSSDIGLFEKLAAIRNVEANTNKTIAETIGVENQNATYWQRFQLDVDSLTASIRNVDAQATINELSAQFKAATMDFDYQKASYSAQSMFYEMQKNGISVQQASATLQQTLNTVAMQAYQSQMMQQSIAMNNVTLDQLVTTWNANKHLVDARAQSELDKLNEEVRRAKKANNWYAFNQVIGGLSSIGSTVATVANAFKPFPQLMTQTTESFNIGEFGNSLGGTVTTRTNTYN